MINSSIQNYNSNQYSSRIVLLSKHNIVFGAMKKSQFSGLNLAVVEKYKAPIEKFNILDDLQNWAKTQEQKISNMDFGGRQAETKVQRKAMLKEWFDYLFKGNDAYTFATSLLVLGAITKGLKPDNDKLPPVLNKGVLADCVSEIDQNTKANSKYQFDFNKMYETKLRALYFEDTKIEGENTGWVKIPSKDQDPENFESNVEKLKTLSHKNWCTKSFNAEPYLSKGDFHVYLEDGRPKLGVRFVDDYIQEIQGELNNAKIPISYFDEVKKHIKEENLQLSYKAIEEIENAEKLKEEINKTKSDLKSAVKNKDVKSIFEYFGIDTEEDKNGFLTISVYRKPSDEYSFSDVGIDENMLFEKVKAIKGNANFCNSQIKTLGNLKSIGGDAYFTHSQVTDLGNLESIGGWASFKNLQIADLGNLKSIGGDAYFYNSQIKTLGSLKSIGSNADFSNSKITDLGELKSIGGYADFEGSKITDLGNLESIGDNADFYNSQVTNLGKLKSIGGNVTIKNSELTPSDFKNVSVAGKIQFPYSFQNMFSWFNLQLHKLRV